MNNKVIEFLIQAKKATYAGKGAEVTASRPNSHDLQFINGSLKYIDTYLGSSQFAGEEALWEDDTPFWSMNYVGRLLAEGFSGEFLKEALLLVTKDKPYRGPSEYSNGTLTYKCTVEGDFEWFNGYEAIWYGNVKVYECLFHGGSIS